MVPILAEVDQEPLPPAAFQAAVVIFDQDLTQDNIIIPCSTDGDPRSS